MKKQFEVEFLGDAIEFLNSLDIKSRNKIYYNLRKAQIVNDPKLFKKLTEDIWEFRTIFDKKYYRLLSFWDSPKKLVIATHGFIKKSKKTPRNEIKKADQIRQFYFEQEKKSNG